MTRKVKERKGGGGEGEEGRAIDREDKKVIDFLILSIKADLVGIVPMSLVLGHLGSTGTLVLDDLVNTQDGDGSVGRELDGLELGSSVINDSTLGHILNITALDVDSSVLLSLLVGSVEVGDGLSSVVSGVFGESTGDGLEGLRESLDGVLVETRAGVGEGLETLGDLNLTTTSSSDEAGILDHGLDHVHTIIDGALKIREDVVGRGTKHDSGNSGLVLGVLLEDSDSGETELFALNSGAETKVLLADSLQLDVRLGLDGTAQTAEVELGSELEKENVELVDEVSGHVADGAGCDNHVHTNGGDLGNLVLDGLLLRVGVVEELLGGVQKNISLGLGTGNIERTCEHGNLGVLDVLDSSKRIVAKDHSAEDTRLVHRGTHELDNTHVIDDEVGGVLGHDGQTGFSDKRGEEILISVLLGGNGRLDTTGKSFLVVEVLLGKLLDSQVLNNLEHLLGGDLVSLNDLTGVETHLNQLSGLLQKLSGEDDDVVTTISNLSLLHFSGEDDHLSSSVGDFHLTHDGQRIVGNEKLLEMVDDHLVHSCESTSKGGGEGRE